MLAGIALAAISGNDVRAVGHQSDNTLIEHWDGNRWEVIPNPAAPERGGFTDMAAVSAREIWAVGTRGPPWPARQRPLIQHRDGTRWSLIPSPVSIGYAISSVAAVPARDIWISATSDRDTVVVKRRFGTRWLTVPTPRIKGQRSLDIAETLGKEDVWAISHTWTRDRILHYHCRG